MSLDLDDFRAFIGMSDHVEVEPRIIRALSLRQPWADAVVYGGKRIENRTAWKGSKFRGRFLIHAAVGMGRDEYDRAVEFMESRGITWRPATTMARGGFIGAATVVDVVHTAEDVARYPEQAPWWMGAFGLVLDDVRPLPFVPWKGMLSFFKVDLDEVLTKVMGADREAWQAISDHTK